jgi:hypothetical protein
MMRKPATRSRGFSKNCNRAITHLTCAVSRDDVCGVERFQPASRRSRRPMPGCPAFIAGYNARFGRGPVTAKNLHRPLTAADNLDEILAWREERTVTLNLTLHYDQMMLLLDPTPFAPGCARRLRS